MAHAPPHIADHTLLRPIGRGSYGEVWVARSATGAYRAIKVVYRDSFDHDRPYEREFNGIQQYERISRASDTQVDILHVGRNDEFFYYVMELADDQKRGQQIDPVTYKPRTLRSEIHERRQLPLAECLEIGIQLTHALEHLHKNGLVHRDVKPSNIVFINAQPKLADPGLVAGLDATKSLVGTEGYVPMEGPGTPASDLFGLGKVLYEISSARDRMDYPELASDLRARPDRDGLIQLNEVILKACDENPKQRYQTAMSMRTDLERVKAGQPIVRARPLVPWRLPAAAVLALATLSLALFFKWNPAQPKIGRAKDMQTSGTPVSAPFPAKDAALADGLVAWWQANGSPMDSAGANHGTLMDGTSYGIGKEGQAFFFNGRSACVSVPYTPAWAFGKRDFAIAIWARFSRVADNQTFLACDSGVANSNQSRWLFGLHNGVLQWQMDGSNGPVRLGKARFNPSTATWHHLAVTRRGSNICFYVDGGQVASEGWSGEVPDAKAPLTIGNAWGGDSFNGLLDDIRIYNRALTAPEVLTLAQVSNSTNSEDLIAVGTRIFQRSEFIISTSFIDNNTQGNVAVLKNGNFLVAWHQGLLWHCYAELFDPLVRPLGTPVCLNADTSDDEQWGPSPAPMPDGGFVACWGKNPRQPTYRSSGRRFDAMEIPITPTFNIDLPDWTSVASYTDGDFIVVGIRVEGRADLRDWPVRAQRFNAHGIPYGPSFPVSTTTTNNGYISASVSYGTDGRFAIAWSTRSQRGLCRVFRPDDSSPPDSELTLNSVSTVAGPVRASYNRRNELLVAWPARHHRVCLRRFNTNSVPEGAEMQMNEAARGNEWNVDLAVGPTDDTIISWTSGSNIFARLLDPRGTPMGHEFRVNRASQGGRSLGWEACPHTAILADGSMVFTWVGNGTSGKGLYLTFFKHVDSRTNPTLASQDPRL